MMDAVGFHDNNDDNIYRLLDSRTTNCPNDCNRRFQMHSSLIRRLSREKELEGHEGCVNSLAWNSKGSLLISGSDDTKVNIWSYPNCNIMHSIETGHSANIFCTKFVPETSDELVLSGAADAEVRLFRMSYVCDKGVETSSTILPAVFHCHSGRVKKLAVEDGNPNVVWSASEDGTLRQHDLRECSSCPPAGSSRQECRSVLLDLRCGAKRSLSDPPKLSFSLKSCDINPTRPHLLLVGGSDAFARLYDRRMLPSLSSCRLRMSPPPCVNFFCPIHLSDNEKLRSHLTHVTFSPNGEEVLLNYSGEHVYLMDVNCAHRDTMQYGPGDLSNMMTFSPLKNSLALPQPGSATFSNCISMNRKLIAGLLKCNKLYGLAEKCLRDHSNLFIGIEACNEALDRNYNDIDLVLRHDFLCTRAALLLKRLWKHDAHMAVRDCYEAWKINSSSFKSRFYMSEALSKLGKHKEALEFAIVAQHLSPSNIEVEERVNDARVHLAEDEAETNTDDVESVNSPSQRDGILSLLDLLYGSRHRDYSLGRRHQRPENSDTDEEYELGIETSGSGYHDYELESMNHGGPYESQASSPQNMEADYQPEPVVDMKQRYVGHCNVGTDIKQASFLGREGTHVASGSDDGRLFIWEKRTGRLVKVLLGDDAVVNCVQCHPNDCTVATSGIDSTVKIWTPRASVQSIVAGSVIGPQPSNLLDAMEKNQLKMSRIQEAVLYGF